MRHYWFPRGNGRNGEKEMNRFDLVIFDLDGTLVNSAADLIAAVHHMSGLLGFPQLSDKEIISYVGDGTDKLVERVLGPAFPVRRDEALRLFLEYYEAHLLDHSTLYPGVSEILDFLKDRKKAVITNKREYLTRKITDGLGITQYFEAIMGMGSTPFAKPDARLVQPLLERFDLDPSRVLMVGDGVTDVKLAQNAGIKSCAILSGFTPSDILLALKPDFACHDMGEVKALFG